MLGHKFNSARRTDGAYIISGDAMQLIIEDIKDVRELEKHLVWIVRAIRAMEKS